MKKEIIKYSKELGFDLIGFTKASMGKESVKAFNKWISKKYNSSMSYMEKKRSFGVDDAKTVITLAVNYYHKQDKLEKGYGRIARYAYGRDYHKIINSRLKKLVDFIKEKCDDKGVKAYVDTGPILERSLAEQSGIGCVGKNSCLITKKFGSWVFLAEVITTLDLKEDKGKCGLPFSICGKCNKCMVACPTGAIVEPGVIDAGKCISFLTIENKGKISKKYGEIIGNTKRVYGCDICQEVCPLNKDAKEVVNKEMLVKRAGDSLDIKDVLSIKNDDEFLKKYAGSALMRAKRKGLQRNARLIV